MSVSLVARFTGITLLSTASAAPAAENAAAALPPQLELTRFAHEPMVQNSVAVTIDEQGRVYATSVVRRQAADLDIRRFKEWIPTELSLTSVEEKQAWFESELVPENSARYAERFEDANGDGSYDVRDLSLLSDRITRLEDTDGDGVADVATHFNATENTLITGIAAGLAAWDGHLYATVEPDLLRLTDTDGDGVPDERKVLAHGFSVHIGYGGHNFSGVTIGPDGRVYASVADRGLHVETADGKVFANPHSGAIVRCEFDGSGFELFATGLRNAQEVAFDAWGNLFSVDNDGDFTGEEERFVYLTEGSDSGWRSNWQHRGEAYLPWMAEGMAVPAHPGQPAYITPPLRTYKDGPAGFAFNPGTALAPAWRDYFFLTTFPSRNLYAFQAEPDGAAFRMVNDHTAASGVLMVGLGFAPDGALYVTDWASSGYPMNDQGAVWRIDVPDAAQSTERRETAALIAADWQAFTTADLQSHLAHADQRVRMKAQFELVRRGDGATLLAVAGDTQADRLARGHAIWGLGQLLRQGISVSTDSLHTLLQDADAELRTQTAKIIGEAAAPDAALLPALRALLVDAADRPRFFAAIALGRLHDKDAVSDLLAYLARDGADAYHRHAAVMGLAGCATAKTLASQTTAASPVVRLGAIVALRRQHSPLVASFLADTDPLVVAEAASAIHDDTSIPAALPALAAMLDHPGDQLERTLRRALSAAQRLRSPEQAARVAALAADDAQPAALRRQALVLLRDLPEPPVLDSVEGNHRPLAPVAAATIAPVVADALSALGRSADFELARLAWETAATYQLRQTPGDLLVIVQQDTPIAAAALTQLAEQDATAATSAAHNALGSQHTAVRQTALRVIARLTPEHLPEIAAGILAQSSDADAQLCLALLAQSKQPAATAVLVDQAKRLREGTLAPELALDVLEAAAQANESAELTAIVSEYQAAKPAADPLAPFIETLHGGDVERGREVFTTSVAAQCTLCHRVSGAGSNVGPKLGGIGAKTPRYLLEAMVDPGATVAAGFGMTTVTLKDGSSIGGNLLSETDTQTTLILADNSRETIARADIAERTPELSAMPPMGLLLSKTELRDLLAYLQSLKPRNEPAQPEG